MGEDEDSSVTERPKRRAQRTRRPIPNGSEGGTGGPVEGPTSEEEDEPEDGGDEEFRDGHSNHPRQRTQNLATAAEPARKLLQLLEKRPVQLDMSWLCHPETENLMSLLQSEVTG